MKGHILIRNNRLVATGPLETLESVAKNGADHATIYSLDSMGCVAEFHSPHASTPSSRWSERGEPDPHGDQYDCERAALTMGDMTDDELANAVYLHGDTQPSFADLLSGKAVLPIAYLTAAKDRIRWLSRQLEKALRA